MKTVILFIVVFSVLVGVAYFLKTLVYSSPTVVSSTKRNYKVRFDSIKEKYYITNELPNGKDQDVVGFFGFRKYYTDKFKVELITEKLNAE